MFSKFKYITYIFSTFFYLNLKSGEIECLTFSHSGKAHKSKYISELHVAQLMNSPTTLIYSTKLHGATPEFKKLMARKKL